MELKLKEEFKNLKMSCPFTKVDVDLKFLPTAMYIHYFNKGYDYMFDVVEEKKSR